MFVLYFDTKYLYFSPYTVDISSLYSNYYQPTLFNASPQEPTSTFSDNVNQPQYNNCYVLDDESNGDINNGRKSTDYVVDHADDYELGDMPQNGIGRKRAYSGGEDLYTGGAPKVVRQQPGATSVHDTQQMPMGTQQVKVEKDMYGGKGTFIPQKSLLKGAGGNKKVIKQEKEHFGKYEMSVPDNSVAVPLQTSTSPSSSTGSGKSFYSKDDLFSDEVPNELFGEDANTVSLPNLIRIDSLTIHNINLFSYLLMMRHHY